jgi:hypothetical protein
MPSVMTGSAERDEILLGIGAALAPKPEVVDFEVFAGSARLALPAVAREDQLAEPLVFVSD